MSSKTAINPKHRLVAFVQYQRQIDITVRKNNAEPVTVPNIMVPVRVRDQSIPLTAKHIKCSVFMQKLCDEMAHIIS